MRSDAFMDVEERWISALDILGLEGVRDYLLEQGLPVTRADGITFWLADQRRRRRVREKTTIVGYRKLLREVPAPGYDPRRHKVG